MIKKLKLILLSGLIFLSSVSHAAPVFAESNIPETVIESGPTDKDPPTKEADGSLTIEETEDTLVEVTVQPTDVPTVEPTVEPTEMPSIDETEEPSIEVTEEPTVEATTEPIETELPLPTLLPTEETVDDDATEDVEATVEPIETIDPTVEPIETVETDNIDSDFQLITISDRISNGESLIIAIGSLSDEQFAEMTEAYKAIMESRNLIGKFIIVDADENPTVIDELTSYTYRSADRSALKNINELEHGAFVFTFNQTVTSVRTYEELNTDYTIKQIANNDIAVAYSEDHVDNSNDDIVMFRAARTVIEEGYEWSYWGKSKLQEFTAPMNGYYKIQLWGADGDSDSGANTQGINATTTPYTTGIGGGGAYTEGTIYLEQGETVYLALGLRNGMSGQTSYNGGGAGYGQHLGYRSGGGGAASVYTTQRGTGELIDYKNYQDEILMVAGGGGGAEDFYATGLDWNADYYCLYNYCETSYGGNGGTQGTTGRGSGVNGVTGGYQFGVGESYSHYENSSSGAGGGGWYGGTSPSDTSKILRGGTGGGGTSYVKDDAFTDVVMTDGKNVNFTWNEDNWFDDGENAKAIITLASYQSYPLTIHYVSAIDGSTLHEDYQNYYKYGEYYEVESPSVDGYTVTDEAQNVISGIMPDEAVEITVYYNYPSLTVKYLEYDTQEVLHPDNVQYLKIGSEYDVESPTIDGYVLYVDGTEHVSGTKTAENEEFIVYYVPEFNPTKHIVAVNGNPISQEVSDTGVTLSAGDIVTYEIRYENRRGQDVTETFVDELPNTVEYMGGESGDAAPTVEGNTITYNITVKARSEGFVRFNVKVLDSNGSDVASIVNWERKDPYIDYDVVKSVDVGNDAYVAYEDEVEYRLMISNRGQNAVHDIDIVDAIPDNTSYLSHSKEHNGTYVSDGNYVKWHIDELPVDGVVLLTFKVTITGQVEGADIIDIPNTAYYNNTENGLTPPTDEELFEEGTPTNEVINHLTGTKLDVIKSSNPENGSIVTDGQEITYNVTMTNSGKATTNYITVADYIPIGTTFKDGSLVLISDNEESNNKYNTSYGSNFDISYNFTDGGYRLSNFNIPDTSNEPVYKTEYKVTYKTDTWTKKTGNWEIYAWGGACGLSNYDTTFQSNGKPATGTGNAYMYRRQSNYSPGNPWGNATVRRVEGYIRADNDFGRGLILFESYYGSYGKGASTVAGQGQNYYFKTNDTPITVLNAYTYTQGISPCQTVSGGGVGYLNTNFNIKSYEQLSSKTSVTDWQDDLTVPSGSTLVSYEERQTLVPNQYTGIEIEYPTTLTPSYGSSSVFNINNSTAGRLIITPKAEQASSDAVKEFLSTIIFKGSYNSGSGSIKLHLELMSDKVEFEEVVPQTTNQTFNRTSGTTAETYEFTAPASGTYQLEVWGAQGGGRHQSSEIGGYGGYAKGTITLNKGDKLYITPGKAGWANMGGTEDIRKAWNGGGFNTSEGAQGGGATSITTTKRGNGELSNYNSYRNEVVIVAGGGGAAGDGNNRGGNSGQGGGSFGVGSNNSTRGGGGGWTGGSAGKGGTSYVNTSLLTNTSIQEGINGNASNSSSAYGRAKITSLDLETDSYYVFNTSYYEVASASTNGATADNTASGGINNAVPSGYMVKSFTVSATGADGDLAAHISFGSIDEDFTGTKTYTFNDYVDMSNLKAHIYTNSSNDGKLKSVSVKLTDYKYIVTPEELEELQNSVVSNEFEYSTILPTSATSKGCAYIEGDNGGYVECVTSDLAVGQSATMQFTVTVDNPLSDDIDQIDNTAYYDTLWEDPGLPGEIEEFPTTPSNTVTHYINEKAPIISAVKRSDPVSGSYVSPLEDIVYYIDVTNDGEANAEYTVVREYIPDNVTYKGGSIDNNGAFVNAEKPYVEWVLYDIGVGETRTVSYTVTVLRTPDYSKDIVRNALYELVVDDPIAAGLFQRDPSQQTNETIHHLEEPMLPGSPSLSASKNANPADGTPVARQSEIQYTLHFENNGTALLPQFYVEDVIPEGTTLKSIDAYEGATQSEYISVKSIVTEREDGDVVRWLVNNLNHGDYVDLKFTVMVDKETTVNSVNNKASYEIVDKEVLYENVEDAHFSGFQNNTNTVTHPLINPSINVVKSSNPETNHVVGFGSTITYTLTVENTSDVMANYSNILDILPSEVTYTDASVTTDNDSDSCAYNTARNAIECTLFDMEAHETRTITFKVTVKDTVRMGDEIVNVGYFDTYITNPNDEEFSDPTSMTNKIVHVVEIHTDTIQTGGDGWSNGVMIGGALMIAVAIGAYLLFKNKEDGINHDGPKKEKKEGE